MEDIARPRTVKQERNSAFEILRIIAILFIIISHFSVHGGFDFTSIEKTPLILFNQGWIDFMGQFGKPGVNLFILISAYFLIDNSRFKTRKWLGVILEMLTFSIILGVTFFIAEGQNFSFKLLRSIAFPFGNATWWFMTTYLILYLFSPLLNLGIRAMNKKAHLILIIVLVVIWSLLPTLLTTPYGFTEFGWFISLYLIAAYIRLYDIKLKLKPWVGILIAVGAFLGGFAIKYGVKLAFSNGGDLANGILHWFNLGATNNIVQTACMVLLFLSFKSTKMKSIKLINLVASTTMAIYLFHDHPEVRNFLWIRLFKNAAFATSPFLSLYSIGAVLAVFFIGVAIGLIYRYTFGLGYGKLLAVLDRKWLYKIDTCFNQIEASKPANE